MIKTTILKYSYPAQKSVKHTKTFRQYVADNGKSIYTIGNRIVTKEEGNREFTDIIKNSKYTEIKKATPALIMIQFWKT